MSQEINKSYFAIIPANVRYDTELTPNAKLLYGEITALCNEKGYCWATNKYFADLYNVSIVSVSKWINLLVKKGYLLSDLIYKEGTKEIEGRYLRIVLYPIKEKFNTPIKEKFKDNSTYINNTFNKDIYISESLFSNETELKTEEEKTKKVALKKVIVSGEELTHEEAFQKFWDLYDKKTDTAKAKAKFLKLSEKDMILAVEKASTYVLSTPDKKYRKNALTWLNGQCWNDEVELKTENNQNNQLKNNGIVSTFQFNR